MGSSQVRNAIYKLEGDPKDLKHVIVYKLDKDFGVLETYHINIHPTFTICSCFAGAKDCRHQKMYRLWHETQAWGKGFMYNFDKHQWIPPTPVEDE